uniref:T-box domain-containing protein n=1 Tax=Panagrolaimus davidi TaxID=227884 RepID=A0A914PKN6_9BILA
MYSNYSWSPESSNPFELQQPFTLPLTPTTTTTMNDSSNLQENQSSCFKAEESIPLFKQEEPFQLTATSEGIKLDDLKARIKIKLVEEKLFNKFKDLQLEMVITKAGRNLFPKLNFAVEGLEPDNCYLFSVMFKRVDNLKYKYAKSQWIENGAADDEYHEQKEFPHTSNTQFKNGKQWMESEISFATLKLTNNQQNSSKNATTSMLTIFRNIK